MLSGHFRCIVGRPSWDDVAEQVQFIGAGYSSLSYRYIIEFYFLFFPPRGLNLPPGLLCSSSALNFYVISHSTVVRNDTQMFLSLK